jgi:RimJ/RimL family protein N-acetyltransferase
VFSLKIALEVRSHLALEEMMKNTIPFETEDLGLRPFVAQDAEALLAYLNNPGVQGRRAIPWKYPADMPLSLEQVMDLIQTWNKGGRQIHLAVCLKVTGDLVGHVNISFDWDPHCPSISMLIAPEQRGNGFEDQLMDWTLGYLFMNTPAHNVDIEVADWDADGIRFIESHGFQLAGRFRREGIRNGKYYDGLNYDLLRPEWLERKGS